MPTSKFQLRIAFSFVLILFAHFSFGQQIPLNSVNPKMTVVGSHEKRSETGIGALIPWADRLWAISYVAHIFGDGIGLYEITDDMVMKKHPASVTGTYANRMIHEASLQAVIGPHFINQKAEVRTCTELVKHRLTATMDHLTDPQNKVLFLTMEGLLFEVDVKTLQAKQLFDLVKELKLPQGAQPHFKGGWTGNGKVVVANNSYDERDYLGQHSAGRLAEWDGKTWKVIAESPFVEVMGDSKIFEGRPVYGAPIIATGWDRASVIMKVWTPVSKAWETYRLPKSSQSFDHTWNTEWMRIRAAQTERFLMDIHGIFYDLPIMAYGGKVWGIRPISNHLRLVPDFCYWRGMLVLAGDQTDKDVGQPQSGLLFTGVDELWKYGKPSGWGGPWYKTDVTANKPSDPYLMTGFDKKVLHLINDGSKATQVTIEVDILGDGNFVEYKTIDLPAKGYVYHTFLDGYSAHWVRLKSTQSAKLTGYFYYN